MLSLRVLGSVEAEPISTECQSIHEIIDGMEEPLDPLTDEAAIMSSGFGRLSQLHAGRKWGADAFGIVMHSISQASLSLWMIIQDARHIANPMDRLLHDRVVHTYQGLVRAEDHIRQLNMTFLRTHSLQNPTIEDIPMPVNKTYASQRLRSRWAKSENDDPSFVETFFDCLSVISADTCTDETEKILLGSAEYLLESMPSFYPEKYVSRGIFDEEVFASAIVPLSNDKQTFRYYLNYAETARRWRIIVLDASFHNISDQASHLQVSSTLRTPYIVAKTLPSAMRHLLGSLLPSIDFYQRVTRLHLDLILGEYGQVTATSTKLDANHERSESSRLAELQMLRHASNAGSKIYVESQIVTLSRIGAIYYKVLADSEVCVETKFHHFGGQGDSVDALMEHLDDFKHRVSLRGCKGVVAFKGIILDDTRTHLRGLLQELPMIMSLAHVIANATSQSALLPWFVRELWARQFIQTIIDVHSQGISIGHFDMNSVGIRADGSVVFRRPRHHTRSLEDGHGRAPPESRAELRKACHDLDAGICCDKNTDMFLLGLLLWLLVWHLPGPHGQFCDMASCNHRPRLRCTAAHANPVMLPACPEDTPIYLREIIERCRYPAPHLRITSRELTAYLQTTSQPDYSPADVQQAIMPYTNGLCDIIHILYCDDCGKVTTGQHYHCSICTGGDYDICFDCYLEGSRCCNPEHHLQKRAWINNSWLDIS